MNGDGEKPDLGWWMHSTVYRYVVKCVPETCIILLTTVTPINSIKGEKEMQKNKRL